MHHDSGVLSALQRCLLEAPSCIFDTLGHSLTIEVLGLLENISLLLLGVLYGDTCATDEGNEAICRNSIYLGINDASFQLHDYTHYLQWALNYCTLS